VVTTRIEVANLKDAEYISKNLRTPDLEEMAAASGMRPQHVIISGLKHSAECYIGYINDKPVCIWGVVSECLLTGRATPWLFGTDDLDKYAITFLKRCKKPLMSMLEKYDTLINYVDVRNTKAISWLKWLGFTVEEEAKPYGVKMLPFRKFYMMGGK
jgi:hypothetical protein